MPQKPREFYYPTILRSDGLINDRQVDEGIRRIYDLYYSQYQNAVVFYRDANGILQHADVTIGAQDSGGTGYRLLRIPN